MFYHHEICRAWLLWGEVGLIGAVIVLNMNCNIEYFGSSYIQKNNSYLKALWGNP